MTINLTLAVQAINFLIAYIMIKKLFLQPAVVQIQEDDAKIKQAQDLIEEKKRDVALEKERIEQQLHAFKEKFLENEPEVARALDVTVTIVPGMPPLPKIEKQKINDVARNTAEKLVDGVAHVN